VHAHVVAIAYVSRATPCASQPSHTGRTARSMSYSPLLDTRDVQATSPKPPSLRSVNSQSSIASGTSLTRRPRIRGRSRTLTGGSNAPSFPDASADPMPSTSKAHLFTEKPIVDADPADESEDTLDASSNPITQARTESSTLHLIKPPFKLVRI